MTSPLMTLRFSLPWPPSVNTYWRHTVRGGKKPKDGEALQKHFAKVYLSEQGQRYRTEAILRLREQQVPKHALKGRLGVLIKAYPPDRRARDLDNLPKGVLDALKEGGVIRDDADIDDLHVVRMPVVDGGGLTLELREIDVIHPGDQLILDAFEQPKGLTLEQIQRGAAVLNGKPPPF